MDTPGSIRSNRPVSGNLDAARSQPVLADGARPYRRGRAGGDADTDGGMVEPIP